VHYKTKEGEKFRKQAKIFITKIRAMMATLTMNYVVCDDNVSYVFDVVDIDRLVLRLVVMNLIVTVMIDWVNVIDFDYYFVEIVCDDDDDDDFCDDDDDVVYEISFFSSFSYVSLSMMMN
jgi:hypothetical protein